MYYNWISVNSLASRARDSAIDANDAARRAENALSRLEDMADRQTLVIRTLLTACEKAGLFNEAQFRELMNDVDLSDGRLDGKFKPQVTPRECPTCHKVNGKRAVTCMYCGNPLEGRDIV
jgi:hypothetical protein